MSLTVKHLNGDSTFLLTFTSAGPYQDYSGSAPNTGTFTVLLDPWLSGDSTIYHPKFALAKHTIPSCIDHLSEIPAPNVVIISQDRTDHCHEATLRQLDPTLRHTIILAEHNAAKKIRSWRYFNPSKIHALPIFSERKAQSIIRFHLPCSVPGASPGEVTIAFIPTKRDMTGLHNAVGITYRGPSFSHAFDIPIGTAYSPNTPSDHGDSSSVLDLPLHGSPYLEALPLTPPESPHSSTSTASSYNPSQHPSPFFPLITPSSTFSAPAPALQPTYAPFRPKPLSVLYSPHGITYPWILPYVTTHLIAQAALPLTLLLHSFDRVQNPWYLGGNISAGVPGGLEIAQNLLARCWVGAHDEDKESSGFSVLKCVTHKYTALEVQTMMEKGGNRGKARVDVRALECGEEMLLKA